MDAPSAFWRSPRSLDLAVKLVLKPNLTMFPLKGLSHETEMAVGGMDRESII
jgi:hypothetical protein